MKISSDDKNAKSKFVKLINNYSSDQWNSSLVNIDQFFINLCEYVKMIINILCRLEETQFCDALSSSLQKQNSYTQNVLKVPFYPQDVIYGRGMEAKI